MKNAIIIIAVIAAFITLHLIGQPADGIVRKEAVWHWSDYAMIALFLGSVGYGVYIVTRGRKDA